MASVRINSGPPTYSDKPADIPVEKWYSLMDVKRSFIDINITYDCRCLLDFLEDVEVMWQELGFSSADDMIENGLKLDPFEVGIAFEWLKFRKPEKAVKYETAVKSGRQLRAERNHRILSLRDHGLTQQQIADEVGLTQQNISNIIQEKSEISEKTCSDTQAERAAKNKLTDRTQRKIDKIRKVNPVLADMAEAKQISVAEAERQSGIAKSRVETLSRYFNKLTDEEKQQFCTTNCTMRMK